MNTHDLNKLLFRNPYTRNYFIGTFPACFSIRTRKKKYALIMNTDSHERPGKHWCGWWVNNDHAIFFDSFGRPPTHHSFPLEFYTLAKRFKTCRHVRRAIQLPGTKSCGHYCFHFVYAMCSGMRVRDFLSKYKNIYDNDYVVRNLVDSIQ